MQKWSAAASALCECILIFDMTRRVAGGGLLIDTRPSVDGAPRVNIDVTRWEGGGEASDYCLIHADRGGGAPRLEINN